MPVDAYIPGPDFPDWRANFGDSFEFGKHLPVAVRSPYAGWLKLKPLNSRVALT